LKRDFDGCVADYGQQVERVVAFSGQSHQFYLEAKARQLVREVHARFPHPAQLRALEVGCGPGLMLRSVGRQIGQLCGIDRSMSCLGEAIAAAPRPVVAGSDALCLPFADGSFDVVFAVCVVHHVPPPARPALVEEMVRVARTGALLAIWEHNPWNPLTRLVVARCPYDHDAVLLSRRETIGLLRRAGLQRLRAHYALIAPLKAAGWERVEQFLSQVPLGAQFLALGEKL
jgi:SAM-dependent methyltransferase